MIYAEREGTSLFKALKASVFLVLAGTVLFCASKFEWLRKKLPMPGEGPSEEVLHSGFFKLKCWGLPHEPQQEGASGSAGCEPARVHSMMAVCTSSLHISACSCAPL